MSSDFESQDVNGLPAVDEAEGGAPGRDREWVWLRRLRTRSMQLTLDLSVLAGAFLLAYGLRFNFAIPENYFHWMLVQLPLVILIQFSAIYLVGIYAFLWRYIGMSEVGAFLKAMWWSFLPIMLMRLALPEAFNSWRVPLSVILADSVLAFGGVLAIRVFRRAVFERYEREQKEKGQEGGSVKPVFLVGAGKAGVIAAREIHGRGSIGMDIRGFVDDDPEKFGSVIQGIRVVGVTGDLPRLVKKHEIDHVIITIAQTKPKDLRRIVDICERIPVKVRIIPGLYEILDGRILVSQIREVKIEDLLGRKSVELDEEGIGSFIRGRVVMVTGAGGSIGSEISRQVARFEPSSLLLLERAEFVLFDIDRELRERFPNQVVEPLVADVGDDHRMRLLFERHLPSVVFHAAAHKHVPMMEMNPFAAVKNNIFGTRTVARCAGDYGVEAFVLISTDKAVRPTSVMGASKRMAELVVKDLDRHYENTRYVSVRFGNVLGSVGSVVPIFREQIAKGGPVTVTHPDMLRFFMTIPEASQLVLQAGAMGEGGEIFILDMGEPVKVLDLAKEMITLSGKIPFEEIDIVFTGIRPGEKLYEELGTDGENLGKTRHPKIFIGMNGQGADREMAPLLARFEDLIDRDQEKDLRHLFNTELEGAQITE